MQVGHETVPFLPLSCPCFAKNAGKGVQTSWTPVPAFLAKQGQDRGRKVRSARQGRTHLGHASKPGALLHYLQQGAHVVPAEDALILCGQPEEALGPAHAMGAASTHEQAEAHPACRQRCTNQWSTLHAEQLSTDTIMHRQAHTQIRKNLTTQSLLASALGCTLPPMRSFSSAHKSS